MGNWGMKVSKPGFDVLTCEDKDLVMSSSFNALKVAHTASPTGVGTYTHGLGYIPAFIVAGEGFFVGQEYSAFSQYFYSNATIFSYYDVCRYWLFYQQI